MSERPGRQKKQLRVDEAPFDPTLLLMRNLSPLLAALDVDAVCAARVVANALLNGDKLTFYSRDRSNFVKGSTLRDAGVTRDCLARTVDRLAAAGYLQSLKTKASPNARYRSRFRATRLLFERVGAFSVAEFHCIRPVLCLRDASGRNVAFRSTPATRRMAREMEQINAFTAQHEIDVDHPAALYDDAGFLIVGGQRLNPNRISYTRIFKRNLDQAGRLYGPFWQNLPRDVRKGLLINGEPTIECDIKACHPRLARALAGQPALAENADPYVMLGLPRGVGKRAFLICMNAMDRRQAEKALANELKKQGTAVCELTSKAIIGRTLEAMPDIPFFRRQALRLQAIDAAIAVAVHLECQAQGFLAVSVHDSFICAAQRQSQLTTILNTAFETALDRLFRATRSRLRREADDLAGEL